MNIKKENINKTMKLLDEKITPDFDEYFLTKVYLKLKNDKSFGKNRVVFFLKPAFIILLLLINLITLIYSFSGNDNNNEYNRNEILEAIKYEVFNNNQITNY